MSDIGSKIRQLREEKGMTQEELALKVGYKSRVSINKIELQRDIPIKKLEPIATALGVTPAFLMGWDEEINLEMKLDNPEQKAKFLKKYEKYQTIVDNLDKMSDEDVKAVELYMDFVLSKKGI